MFAVLALASNDQNFTWPDVAVVGILVVALVLLAWIANR